MIWEENKNIKLTRKNYKPVVKDKCDIISKIKNLNKNKPLIVITRIRRSNENT